MYCMGNAQRVWEREHVVLLDSSTSPFGGLGTRLLATCICSYLLCVEMRSVRKRPTLLCLALIVFSGVVLYALQTRRYSEPAARRPPYRFVVGLNYWEQLSMAMHNFFKLASLASQWNLRTVVPFTHNSRLYGLKNFKPDEHIDVDEEALSLSAIYDMESVDSVVAKLGLPAVASFEEFVMLARRRLVVIHLVAEKAAHEVPVLKGAVKTYLQEEFSQSNVVDCRSQMTSFGDQLLSSLNQEAARHKVSKFRIDKYFCVNISQRTTPQELAIKMRLSPDEDSDMSVIVFNWRGFFDTPVLTASAKGSHPNNRLILSGCETKAPEIIRQSSRVIAAANRYMQHLNLTGNYLAIHLRSEKMGHREERFPGAVGKCMEKVLATRDQITSEVPSLRTIFITDYGPYSSDTCLKCKGGFTVSKLLAEKGLAPTHYDPVALGEVADRGFAAAVELRVMAKANFLILCGGGAFQSQAAQRFLQEQDSGPMTVQRLFMVCTDDARVNAVLQG